MRRAFLALVLMLAATALALAQQKKAISGFDGGMMVHTGFLKGDPGHGSGMPLGIGGTARLHLGEHFRFGMEGYVSNLSRGSGGSSYVKYGWGGLLGDFSWQFGRFMPFAGVTIGGGSATALLMDEMDGTQIVSGTYERRGFLAVDPFIGCEYALSEDFHLSLKADWLLSPGKRIFATGPRLYIGFIFCH